MDMSIWMEKENVKKELTRKGIQKKENVRKELTRKGIRKGSGGVAHPNLN